MKILGKQSERGQSLIEFAITLPVIILILSGLFDLGRAYFTFIALEEAVAEAALYLAISPDCPDDNNPSLTKCENPNNALYRAITSGNGEFDPARTEWNIPFTTAKENAGWANPFDQDCAAIGCNVIVQVEYSFELLTPGIQRLVSSTGADLILSTQATQVIVFDQR